MATSVLTISREPPRRVPALLHTWRLGAAPAWRAGGHARGSTTLAIPLSNAPVPRPCRPAALEERIEDGLTDVSKFPHEGRCLRRGHRRKQHRRAGLGEDPDRDGIVGHGQLASRFGQQVANRDRVPRRSTTDPLAASPTDPQGLDAATMGNDDFVNIPTQGGGAKGLPSLTFRACRGSRWASVPGSVDTRGAVDRDGLPDGAQVSSLGRQPQTGRAEGDRGAVVEISEGDALAVRLHQMADAVRLPLAQGPEGPAAVERRGPVAIRRQLQRDCETRVPFREVDADLRVEAVTHAVETVEGTGGTRTSGSAVRTCSSTASIRPSQFNYR